LLGPEDGGSTFLRNVGIYLYVHTAVTNQETNTAMRTSNHIPESFAFPPPEVQSINGK
jgi:hypothetical protein